MGSGRVLWDLQLVGYSSQTSKIEVWLPQHDIKGPADLALTSSVSSPDTNLFQQFCTGHIPRTHCAYSYHCFSTCSSFCLECPSLTFLCLEKKCIHLSKLSAATIISFNSSLNSLGGKNVNHCLFIVLCPCCNYHDASSHSMSVSFTWLWASEIRIEFYFIKSWYGMGHLVVLDKCSINEWTKKKESQCDKKVFKIFLMSKWL